MRLPHDIHLEALDPDRAKVVELRFYGGRSEPEVARMLGLSESTVRRRWASARAFLRRELRAGRRSASASA